MSKVLDPSGIENTETLLTVEEKNAEVVEREFYDVYLTEREKLLTGMSAEHGDAVRDPINAARISLLAASVAAQNCMLIPQAEAYLYEFRLPEQYFTGEGRSLLLDSQVHLLDSTRGIATEIIQAWIINDRLSRDSIIEDKHIHRSLRHTQCSFGETLLGTDINPEDIGVTGLTKEEFGKQRLTTGYSPEDMANIISSFGDRVKSW